MGKKKEEVNSKLEDCIYCANTGRTKDDPFHCKYCGRDYKGPDSVTKPILENVYIPRKYRDNLWTLEECINKFKNDYSKGQILNNAKKWAEVLNLIIQYTTSNKIYEMPFIYIGSVDEAYLPGWTYTLMTYAEKSGYSVDGIIDLIDLDIDSIEERNKLMSYDILIIRLSNYKLEESLKKLNYIIPNRIDKDKMTVIETRLPFDYLKMYSEYITFDKPMLVEKFY